MGNYVFTTDTLIEAVRADAENKADIFASRMVRGVNHHR